MYDLCSLLLLVVVVCLGLSLIVYQCVTGVPPMSSTRAEGADVAALLKRAGLARGAIVYDLGCGWGTLVTVLARAFPDAQIRGIELSPFPYWIARFRTRGLRNVVVRRADFYTCDLGDANAVTCYLMIKPMPKLANLLDRMIVPGTPVVALTFWFRDRQASAQRNGPGLRGAAALYIWPALKS
jgi:protein-L-isoaspartate O-methyltransferase